MMERSLDMVLSDMGIRSDYFRLPSGQLVQKEREQHNTGAFRSQRGRGRGGFRGRANSRRGGGNCGNNSTEPMQTSDRIQEMIERESVQNSDTRDGTEEVSDTRNTDNNM